MPLTPDEAKDVVRLAKKMSDANGDFYHADSPDHQRQLYAFLDAESAFTRYIAKITER